MCYLKNLLLEQNNKRGKDWWKHVWFSLNAIYSTRIVYFIRSVMILVSNIFFFFLLSSTSHVAWLSIDTGLYWMISTFDINEIHFRWFQTINNSIHICNTQHLTSWHWNLCIVNDHMKSEIIAKQQTKNWAENKGYYATKEWTSNVKTNYTHLHEWCMIVCVPWVISF